MSSQPPLDNGHNKKLVDINGLLDDAKTSVVSILGAFTFQILGNSDTLHESVSEPEQAAMKLLVENMVKKPFRRQIGRLKNLNRLLEETQRQYQLQQKESSHDSKVTDTGT